MKTRFPLIGALMLGGIVAVSGCAVTRGQETVGAYIDDTAITAGVKTRLLADDHVAGTSITVETLNGTVMLSGFAKSRAERSAAAAIARQVEGVKPVRNEITVRPAS